MSGRLVKVLDVRTGKKEILPFSGGNFAWSPDGKTIAFNGIYQKEYGPKIILYDVKTKDFVRLEKYGGDKQ